MTFISVTLSPIALITTTPMGVKQLNPLRQSLGANLWIPEHLTLSLTELYPDQKIQTYDISLKEQIAQLWSSHRAFIFSLSTGAVIRLISPLLTDKSTDPAIIVIDEGGKFVISLLGGHQGGADQLTRTIAHLLNATPVLTGAANYLKYPPVDLIGKPWGWNRGEGNWTGVAAAISRGEKVEVIQEIGSDLWRKTLPENHPFLFDLNDLENQEKNPSPHARIWITYHQRKFAPDAKFAKIQWHPRVLWVGIGCERGTPRNVIEKAIESVCDRHHLAAKAIAGIATVDLKENEEGLIELCQAKNWPLKTFSAATLAQISVPNPSEIVREEVGTPSVAEAAAICAASLGENQPKTLLLSHPNSLLVSKQIVKFEGEPGAVTVAFALSEQEYIGKPGKLLLIGTGPGDLSQMTPAAQSAICEADVIIGYTLYIDLIRSLFHPVQVIETSPITQERQRAERAIELAKKGLTIAVISSGDCGIYGMAGLVFEKLEEEDWNGHTPSVTVYPGITALQAAASRVGAPLMHDFCTISLSDLLTPWEVIETRIIAAASADFVLALYNPKSATRTEQIRRTQEIFLHYRDKNTPVAIAHSVYRNTEKITLTTLGKMLEFPIDMLTVIIIGNKSTRFYENWMITPRGYSGF